MIIKQLKIAIFLIFASTTATNSEQEYVEALVSGRYNFNHPPNVEDYNPIPVAVVYDEEAVSAKNTPIENDDGSNPHENESREDIKTTTLTTSGLYRSNYANKKDLKPKGQTLNEQQIPVAVIYDTEFEKVTNYGTPNQALHNRSMYRSRVRRAHRQPISKLKVNETKKQTDDENTLKISTENAPTKIAVPSQTNSENVQSSNEKISIKPKKRTRERDPVVPIIESENFVYSHRGNFRYSYEGGDGTKAFETGELRTFDDDTAGEAVVGGFSYTDKDGNDYSLSYTADENGYRPVGAHLPTSPPIPPAIARALLYLSTKTTPQFDTESSTPASSLKT